MPQPSKNHARTRTAKALKYLHRPLTGRQLAQKLDVDIDTTSRLLRRLRKRDLVECLNPEMRRGRVYARADVDPRRVDWSLYGWLSFSHRRAVLKALDRPRQPADVKRRARYLDPDIKMSANNARDVVYEFLEKGIVKPVRVRGKVHKRYELTEVGHELRELMLEGES